MKLTDGADLDPVPVRVIDEIYAHIRVFETYAVHFFVESQCGIHIVYAHCKMGFIVAQFIRPVHIAQPGELQHMRGLSVAEKCQLEASVVGFVFLCDGQPKRLLIKIY